jgi:hypothetical protein
MINMEKKQTAVEWFYQRILAKDIQGVFEQAKKMEKEQIIKANRDGVDMVIAEVTYVTGEQYYNETYGGESNTND